MTAGPLSWEHLDSLFSVIMVLDEDLRIVRSSDTLARHVPGVAGSPHLTDLFEVKRPTTIQSYEEARRQLNVLFLMITHDDQFAIRGQIIEAGAAGDRCLYFLGAPWLSWLHIHRPDVRVGLKDFTPQDAQMDQLFYMSTEKRMVEDLEQLNAQLRAAKEEIELAQATKDAFFAQVSHEMRTPLNGVVSAITLLRDQPLEEKARELLGLARESSHNLMQVINYVLDVSKLEHVQPNSDTGTFDLPQLIASVLDIVRARAIENGLQLRSHVDASLPSLYRGQATLIRQALLNLVINAIKFTEHGDVAIDVGAAVSESMTLRIEVRDSGIGIGEENLARIFEPFQVVSDAGRNRGASGTGLGLDIVRRSIRSMGGSVGVTSTLGEGSTFWMELPCEPVSGEGGDARDNTETERQSFNFVGRVLLVDDNETNLMLGGMILESMGVDVVTAASGEEAVSVARDRPLDIVFMDINMPGMDGFEATRRIRAFRDRDALPIIALTAYASSTEREKSDACGMNGYLTKPIERDELAGNLSIWLPWAEGGTPAGSAGASGERGASLVDHAVLDDLAEQIGGENLTRVIGKFLDEIGKRWQSLERAETNSDLSREAHTLASTCRSFGLPSLADKLACIERHAKFGDAAGEPPCLDTVGRELTEGAAALQDAVQAYQRRA